MNRSQLSKEHWAALAALKEAEDRLRNLGYIICRAAIWYKSPKSAHFATRIAAPAATDSETLDHAFADSVRDLGVEWSNSRHAAQLKWVAGKKKPKPRKSKSA